MGSHNVVCSTHACDFTNGYFQGQEIDRILLYRIPGGEILASRVPVYDTRDAGRGLWLRLKNVQTVQFSLSQILPTLFTLRNEESKIIAEMSSNVDDLLYCYLPEGAANSVLQQFLVGKEEHGTFRFCGKEFRQDEGFGIHVTAKDDTERVQPITYDASTLIEIRHTISCLDRKTDVLTFHSVFRRFKALSKMLTFETCVSAIVL